MCLWKLFKRFLSKNGYRHFQCSSRTIWKGVKKTERLKALKIINEFNINLEFNNIIISLNNENKIICKGSFPIDDFNNDNMIEYRYYFEDILYGCVW